MGSYMFHRAGAESSDFSTFCATVHFLDSRGVSRNFYAVTFKILKIKQFYEGN